MEQINRLEASACPSLLTPERTHLAWRIRLSALVIMVTGIVAYVNSFEGTFLFDDLAWVGRTQQLWPPWSAMFTSDNASRPLVGLSLAINYAINGTNIFSYHAFNLTIHILAALTLFGVVRRTLLCESLRERFGQHSTSLAMVVALIWMVHPLQTQSVTYIIQRCESMMGLFYLLTLYCVIRSSHSLHRRWWYGAAIASCAAGMLSKQVMVTAPILVFLYDALFLSGSIKGSLQKRWGLYAGLAATWGLLVVTAIISPANPTAGFAVRSITPWEYLKSEFAVIVYYLRLAVWPDSLCFDYGWKKAETIGEILPFATVVIGLGAATVWALMRRKAIGFLGVWFFLILSVTSSIIPFDDLIFEYRMYLPLAAVVGLFVLAGYEFGKRFLAYVSSSEQQQKQRGRLFAITAVTLIVTSFCLLTLRRNIDYKSPLVMWSDVVEKRPANARGHNNLGQALAAQGLFDEALIQFSEAQKYKPNYADAKNFMAQALILLGRTDEGKAHLSEALRINPNHRYALYNMGHLLISQEQLEQAIPYYDHLLQLYPRHAEAYSDLGIILEKQGKMADAIKHFNEALRLQPELPDALNRLALILATQTDQEFRNTDRAILLAEKAVQLTQSRDPFSLYVLATTYAEAGRFAEAIEVAQNASWSASSTGNKELAATIDRQLMLYREGRTHPAKKL
jgi:tetratricopeptide (TPR) repeat protein